MWYKITENILDFRSDLNDICGLKAAKKAILNIQKNYPPPYHIMLSGGVDSQAMLYSWKLFGSNFIPYSVIYDKNLFFNNHDLKTLNEFSKINNIEITYYEFDILNFYKNNYHNVALEFECSSPQIATYIEMTKNLPGTVIFSGTWLSKPKFLYNRVQHSLTLYSRKRNCIPFFFLSDPDLAYSGIKLNLNLKRGTTDEVYIDKVEGYHKAGFPVIPQEKKFTGFEKIKDYYDDNFWNQATPKMRLTYNYKPSQRTFDILLRYPYEDKFPEIDYKFLLND